MPHNLVLNWLVGLASLAAMAFANAATAQQRSDVVAFAPTLSDRYVDALMTELERALAEEGLTLSVVEAGYNQALQDELVSQQRALGVRPRVWVWWPIEGAAARGSLRILSGTGVPVLQINQPPTIDAEALLAAFVGPDSEARGRAAGELIMEAAEALRRSGRSLAGGARAIAITYPVSSDAYAPTMRGLHAVLDASDITLVAEANEGFTAEEGFNGAERLLSRLGRRGVDIIYAMDDALLEGVMRAVVARGLSPGPGGDVALVGSNCNGRRQFVVSGTQFGTTFQSPVLEARLAAGVVRELARRGGVERFITIAPALKVRSDRWQFARMAGPDGEIRGMDALCSWR